MILKKEYDSFLENKKNKELDKICEDENLKYEEIKKIISDHLFSDLPMKHYFKDIRNKALKVRPKLREISKIKDNIVFKLEKFIEIYEN